MVNTGNSIRSTLVMKMAIACLMVSCLPAPSSADRLFEARQEFAAGIEPDSVAIGDLDGDGVADLAVANVDYYEYDLTIHKGRGDGTFVPVLSLPTDYQPYSIKILDLNDDHINDLAYLCGYSVAVRLGNGDGSFGQAMDFLVTTDSDSMTPCDVNGDGRADLAVVHRDQRRVGILLGLGDGTFEGEVTFDIDAGSGSVAVGDLDGDGHEDLVMADINGDAVSILFGRGNGFFDDVSSQATGYEPVDVDVGDLNGVLTKLGFADA